MTSNLLPKGITKALSLKQPYAWLIANGYLLVDDRTWGTPYRGPVLIHASKGLYEVYYDYLKLHTDIPLPAKDKLEYGGVVGIANLVLCCRPGAIPKSISHQQRNHFGGIHQEYFGFLFEQARPLALLPCRGKLGIFEIDMDELLAAPPAAQAELF
ncbi:MAG: hypothetical protein PSV17_08705 [Methylotenera sp.]|uniref:hypothetical protein n=1 Tax=Methylotenera sp. TaxID=2051956 RepID=UPI002487DF6C|nr:hypothetical protein [Methylotenera sp.]MDI1309496.1 hypothetical protein [Methylotenera sp.]